MTGLCWIGRCVRHVKLLLLGLLGLYVVRRTATLDSLTSRAAAFRAQIGTLRSAFPIAVPRPSGEKIRRPSPYSACWACWACIPSGSSSVVRASFNAFGIGRNSTEVMSSVPLNVRRDHVFSCSETVRRSKES